MPSALARCVLIVTQRSPPTRRWSSISAPAGAPRPVSGMSMPAARSAGPLRGRRRRRRAAAAGAPRAPRRPRGRLPSRHVAGRSRRSPRIAECARRRGERPGLGSPRRKAHDRERTSRWRRSRDDAGRSRTRGAPNTTRQRSQERAMTARHPLPDEPVQVVTIAATGGTFTLTYSGRRPGRSPRTSRRPTCSRRSRRSAGSAPATSPSAAPTAARSSCASAAS